MKRSSRPLLSDSSLRGTIGRPLQSNSPVVAVALVVAGVVVADGMPVTGPRMGLLLSGQRLSGTTERPEGYAVVARTADRGKDVSAFFRSRQAVIKTLVRQALDQHY